MNSRQFANIKEGHVIHTINTLIKSGYIVVKKNKTTVWCIPNLPANQWLFSKYPLIKGVKASVILRSVDRHYRSAELYDRFKNRLDKYETVVYK